MRPKISTEINRGYQWNREDAQAQCLCGAHIKVHRWLNPKTREEEAKARRKGYEHPPRLLAPRRCWLCAWRLWSERAGCTPEAIKVVESLYRTNGRDRCAA